MASTSPTSFSSTLAFVRLASLARSTILHENRTFSSSQATTLPVKIARILSRALKLRLQDVQSQWEEHRCFIMDQSVVASENDIKLYNEHALRENTSYRHLYPPVNTCQQPECTHYKNSLSSITLTDPLTYKATLFTLSEGSLPIYTTSLYCRGTYVQPSIYPPCIHNMSGCNQRYYSNYFVHKKSSMRSYYDGVPDVIQVAQHYFIETALLEFFTNGMVFGWLSSSNSARIYNHTFAYRNPHIRNNRLAFASYHSTQTDDMYNVEWQCSMHIRDTDVLNGVFLYALLLDKAEHQSVLILPHDERRQSDRLKPALAERNTQMEGPGQEAYCHACDDCYVLRLDESGVTSKIHAAVTDGTYIGHRCCAVHDCHIPLASQRHRFCPTHADFANLCAVKDCGAIRDPKHKTCNNPDHRSMETAYFREGRAFFTLKEKLRKAGVAVQADSLSAKHHAEINSPDEVVLEMECVDKEAEDMRAMAGRKKLQAYFGLRRTHNEQLIMRPCGVLLSRAAFFGSEAVSSVTKFTLRTFPTPRSMPEVYFYDSACTLRKFIEANGIQEFNNTALPVDVFHFRSKHKDSDTYCQQHCNPAAFPELYNEKGEWIFNTSICEQTNVWYGGYLAIVRDMEATRYNFFLDEMIKRRNRYIIAQLDRKGKNPHMLSPELLLLP